MSKSMQFEIEGCRELAAQVSSVIPAEHADIAERLRVKLAGMHRAVQTPITTANTMRNIKIGPLTISQESLDSIIEQAGYGIGYWAESAEVDSDAKTYTVYEQEAQDDDNKGVYTIPFDKLHETYWRIVAGEYSMAYRVRKYFLDAALDGAANEEEDIDAGHIDSEAADVLIQIAAFGEIVYG
jgi:hypothetical protein